MRHDFVGIRINFLAAAKGSVARLALALCLAALAACADQDSQAPPQYWKGVEVTIESRPTPPRLGMNEILVVATRPHRQAEHALLVSIRMREDQPWVQAIQDGHTGIFRRAIAMREPGPQTLWVRLQGKTGETVLRFSLVVGSEK